MTCRLASGAVAATLLVTAGAPAAAAPLATQIPAARIPATQTVGEIRPVVLDITPQVLDITATEESIDGSETVVTTEDKQKVILTAGVLFAEEKYAITQAARQRLRGVAGRIRESGATGQIQIDGFTDDQGDEQIGLVLSRNRANAVKAVLAQELAGVPVSFATKGYGEARPIAPNRNPADRAQPQQGRLAEPRRPGEEPQSGDHVHPSQGLTGVTAARARGRDGSPPPGW